jgi:DNA-binding response OmpR family regulator
MSIAFIIEDNRQMSDTLRQMLNILGIASNQYFTPGAAIAGLSALKPDIIFLDIHLPGVDGFEVLAYLRREPRLMGVPVVVVTSDDQVQTREKSIELGAVEVLIKPINFDQIEDVLKQQKLV